MSVKESAESSILSETELNTMKKNRKKPETELQHLTIIDSEYLDYFNANDKHGKTQFELDIDTVLHGAIDKYNADALTTIIMKRRDTAKCRLREMYERNLSAFHQAETDKAGEIARLISKIKRFEEANDHEQD